MKYHPHGDASIGDAMVQIGNKNLLLDIKEIGVILLLVIGRKNFQDILR